MAGVGQEILQKKSGTGSGTGSRAYNCKVVAEIIAEAAKRGNDNL
jgi:hypothetical protein